MCLGLRQEPENAAARLVDATADLAPITAWQRAIRTIIREE
jgi:hypothetical protein